MPENADPLRDQWQPFDIGKLHNASLAKGGDVPPWPADYWTLWKPGGSAGCCTTSYTGLVSMPGSNELMMTYDMFSGCPESRHLNASSCYLIVSMKLHAEAAAHGPVERLKTDDSNSEWTDTTDGIHLFQLWGARGSLNAGKGPLGAHGTGIPLYDFLWGATTADLKLWHAANLRRRSSSPRLRSSSHASSSAASTRLSLNAYWNMRLYRAIASRVTTSPSGHGTRYSSSSASHPSRLGTRNDAEAALASDDDDGEDALVAPVASRAGSNLGLNLAASGSCSALDFIAALWNRASSSRSAVAGRGGRARSPPASSKNC